jgi:hypothetical protein
LVLDLVPVDYVADAIARNYGRNEAAGQCYHLAAGPDGSATARELVDVVCQQLETPRARCLDPGHVPRPIRAATSTVAKTILPRQYRIANLVLEYQRRPHCQFDVSQARAVGLTPPRVVDYFPRFVQYAYESVV